jgi:hypothetical protein
VIGCRPVLDVRYESLADRLPYPAALMQTFDFCISERPLVSPFFRKLASGDLHQSVRKGSIVTPFRHPLLITRAGPRWPIFLPDEHSFGVAKGTPFATRPGPASILEIGPFEMALGRLEWGLLKE